MSIKPSKVQERGIQTSVQSAKNKVQHRFIYPVSKVQKRCRSFYNNWSTSAGGVQSQDICIIRYGCLTSNLSPLWAVSGKLPCLVSAKNLKGCLLSQGSEKFPRLARSLSEHSVQAVDPADAVFHAWRWQLNDGSLLLLLQ